MKKTLLAILLSCISILGLTQTNFIDGRSDGNCKACQSVINSRPKEVLFGIHINESGEIYFSMNNKDWFEKIFKNNTYGVAVDIVTKDRYICTPNASLPQTLPKGVFTSAIYKNALLANNKELIEGGIYSKIGTIPAHLKGKELEGNLVVLNGSSICFYTNFVDIPRSSWQLLPMGLFTDSLVSEAVSFDKNKEDFFTYTEKIKIEIPFSKGSSSFNPDYLKKYFDSIKITSSRIKKVELRAYSSVEGTQSINKTLMTRRAESMVAALKKIDPSLKRISIITAENWIDFFRSIRNTKFEDFEFLSKFEIKKQLLDKKILSDFEPMLATQRKVTAVLYVEKKSPYYNEPSSGILNEFQKAISVRDIRKAQDLQKEIANRISDNKLPLSYINTIEIPKSKVYSPVLNDREVYKYMLKATDEYEAFENFIELKKIDPDNGRLNYNICALRFFMWQYGGDSTSKHVLLKEIEKLQNQGISFVLSERMKVNYYILKSEDQLQAFNYTGKDSSLNEIKKRYANLSASDEDILSLAKYYSYYSQQGWAQDIVEPKIADINVNEDLLFYYLNLLFFRPDMYDTDEFWKATLNAVNLNKERFCALFKSSSKGGASMQLLESDDLRDIYCSECIR